MTVNGMRTEADLMASAAADAGGVAAELTQGLTALMGQLEPLVTQWQGDGGTAFQAVREAVDAEMRNLNAALQFLADEVGASGTTYTTTDTDMSQRVTTAGAEAGSITRLLKTA
jgi:WXG100 family type VII secretion target